MSSTDLTVQQLEELIDDAERAFRQSGKLRHRSLFIAQYIYDTLHPRAGEVDASLPEGNDITGLMGGN